MRKILLTGGEGFVGTGLQNLVSASENLANAYTFKSFDLRSGQDIREYDQIRNAIDFYSPDLIIHLAAQAYVPESTTNPERGFHTNLIGTLNLLEAVKQTRWAFNYVGDELKDELRNQILSKLKE